MRAVVASETKKWVRFSVAMSPIRSRRKPRSTCADGPAGEVDHDPGQGLVERRIGMAEAADAAALAQRLVEGRAQRQGAVLGGVVVVDVEVALAVQLEVEPAVLGQGRQHVVEEAEAGLDVGHGPRRRA